MKASGFSRDFLELNFKGSFEKSLGVLHVRVLSSVVQMFPGLFFKPSGLQGKGSLDLKRFRTAKLLLSSDLGSSGLAAEEWV